MMVAARLRLGECAGVVERVVVSRAGEFSCPVQCGVLFMADCNISQWAKRPNQENVEILQAFQVNVFVLHMHQLFFSWYQVSVIWLPCKAKSQYPGRNWKLCNHRLLVMMLLSPCTVQ